MQTNDPVRSQMVKGLVDLAVLTVIEHGETYGYEILGSFEKTGLEGVGHASMYGSLKRLEAEGCVKTRERPSPKGPPRRYYSITPVGIERRRQMRSSWSELVTALTSLEEGL